MPYLYFYVPCFKLCRLFCFKVQPYVPSFIFILTSPFSTSKPKSFLTLKPFPKFVLLSLANKLMGKKRRWFPFSLQNLEGISSEDTECIKDLGWSLVKEVRWLFSGCFWLLLEWAILLGSCGSGQKLAQA